MQEVKALQGETVIKQGDDGDFLFAIERGSLECYKKLPDGSEPMVKLVNRGDVFGELALLYNTTRAASVVVKEDAVMWKLDRETFNAIVKDASQAKREKFEKLLAKLSLFKDLDAYERSQLADALGEKTCTQGETIITQGESDADSFYVLTEGECKASIDGNDVMTYGAGDYFGELALIFNKPRKATVKATKTSKLLTINRSAFSRLLGPLIDIMTRDAETKYMASKA